MLIKIKTIIYKINTYLERIKLDKPERNRFLLITIASLIFIDYLLFCYIASKNPFDIFPVIPLLEEKKLINIYIPDVNGKTIIKETRQLAIPEENEAFVRTLIEKVVKGSNIENTSVAVPVELFVRKIWIYQDNCIIDIVPTLPAEKTKLIPGSETIFRVSLEKTITENIPSIKKIIILERGIPSRSIWNAAI